MFYASCYLHEIAVIIIVHLGQLLNTAHRVFKRVYNGILSTVNVT
jgi:hypothetical protein